MELQLELVTDGLAFPEGPVALADGSVILVEIQGQRLTRVTPDGRKETLAETGGGPNGAAIGPDGCVWITNNGGAHFAPDSYRGGFIQRFDPKTGELAAVYEACEGARLLAPNDLVFDRQGGLWFTDLGLSTGDGHRFGALYHALPDGSKISRQRQRLMSPNGVGLSPDERVVHVADTQLARLWAFDVEAPGSLAPPEGFAPGRVVCNLPGYQGLDSLAVEADGKVCVATIFNGGITVIDPADGSFEHLAVPDPYCTNICFGGDDMRDAWITASGTGKLYKTRWPRPGLRLNFNA
jgi:gluconolactonase